MNASSYRIPRLLSLVLLTLTFAAPAWAQWPTTEWVVMDEKIRNGNDWDEFSADWIEPVGERGEIADKHRRILEAASIWYRALGFSSPVQQMTDVGLPGSEVIYLGRLKRASDGIGSYHSSGGEMMLTSNPRFLSVDTPKWKLMEASAVHELYHGIQLAESPSLRAREQARPPELPECKAGETNLDWLVEGTAAMVQIRWLEGKQDVSWGHPFKGSHRAAWVRHFDQSLHMGLLPPEHQISEEKFDMTAKEPVSWYCSYGTWYLWYAIGDMIGRNDAERVAYTRYLFKGNEPWDDGGIANVDSGLKIAAAKYNAIKPYRLGLYDLYPQFVAQYLTGDRFYAHLEKVELGAPGLYKTTSSLSDGPLGPLASRAWRVRVRLPENVSSIPYKVRFTLDAPDGTDLDDLHLIVDDKVYKQHADPTVPYAAVRQIEPATVTSNGIVEYLVRVANVARTASETTNAEFSLRVEVDGHYGNDVSNGLSAGDIGAIAGELPPGFDVRGPKKWSCSGNATSRALFDLVTPDEKGRDIERATSDIADSMQAIADKLDIITQKAQRDDLLDSETAQQMRAEVAKGRSTLEATRATPTPRLDAAAAKARARQTTTIHATFVGQDDGGMCQMLLSATLTGRAGGTQSVAGAVDKDRYPRDEAPIFNVDVVPQRFFDDARRGFRTPEDKNREHWKACTMTAEERQKVRKRAARIGCEPVACTAGRLNLEEARQGRIAGTFEFEVIREKTSGRCDIPLGRDNVVGHFNVSSTDDGYDDNSLHGGIAAGLKGGSMATRPGAPILDTRDALDDALDNMDLDGF